MKGSAGLITRFKRRSLSARLPLQNERRGVCVRVVIDDSLRNSRPRGRSRISPFRTDNNRPAFFVACEHLRWLTPSTIQQRGAAVTVADLLTSQAGGVSMSDLLPGSPAIDAPSTQQENWAAPLEQPVGAQFAAIAYRGDAATALQVLPAGKG